MSRNVQDSQEQRIQHDSQLSSRAFNPLNPPNQHTRSHGIHYCERIDSLIINQFDSGPYSRHPTRHQRYSPFLRAPELRTPQSSRPAREREMTSRKEERLVSEISESDDNKIMEKCMKDAGVIGFVTNSTKVPIKIERFLHLVETSQFNSAQVKLLVYRSMETLKKKHILDVLKETPLYLSNVDSCDKLVRYITFIIGKDFGLIERNYETEDIKRSEIRRVLTSDDAIFELTALVENCALNNMCNWSHCARRF